VDIRHFFSRIDELGAMLRAEGMAHGADVWLSVSRLLHRLEQKGSLPDDARELAPLLGPLFCRNPEDQARFPVLFEQWLTGAGTASLAGQNRLVVPGRAALIAAQNEGRKIEKIWQAIGLMLLVCVLVLAIVKVDWFRPIPTQSPIKIEESIQPRIPLPRRKPQPPKEPQSEVSAVTIVDHIPPRRQPEPDYLRQDWENVLRNLGWTLFALPWLPFAWFVGRRYHRQKVLRKQRGSTDDLLHYFRFDRLLLPFFGGAKTEKVLRELHAARFEPTQRLNITATIEATARGGGYFQPVYRNRRVAPEHLLLVRSQHRNDQQAALAEELVKRFRSIGLQVNAYRFRDDPRWLMRWHDDQKTQASYYHLTDLVARHGAARLLIVSEAAILFHPYSGEMRSWLDDFTPWQDKVWLHTRDAEPAHAALLARHRFLLLPLAQDNLPQVIEHLTTAQPEKLTLQWPHTLPLPTLLARDPDAWLGERPPYGTDFLSLVRELEQFLGTGGLRLLRAVAVFPKPHWALTRALDFLLFTHLNTAAFAADPPQRREQRLARLSRLPWLTHAHLPDWLREHLLTHIDSEERKAIATAWQRLFYHLTAKQASSALSLEVRTPSKRQLRLQLDDLRATSKDGAISDPIFANILLGGKLGLLDFRIPQAIGQWLPKTNRSLILRPALRALFCTVIAASSLYATWHTYGQHAFLDYQRNRIAEQNAQWRVTLNDRDDTQVLAEALQTTLKAARFSISGESALADPQSKTNNIRFPSGGQLAAERIARSLKWLTYGAEVELIAANNLPPSTIQVDLNRTYQHAAGFSDELSSAQESRLPFEPEMVLIPPGKFLMGSNEGDSDEQPIHEVTIAYTFEISKYEVTFKEYDVFANATKRDLPTDSGWWRGNYPVIDVSFNDAQAYVKWLSDKTGKKYRLPTEAEWEYAARAGMQTSYWWGDGIGKNNANCYSCGSQWDRKQTAPVGSFKPNPFGLHDTAGNVWEWVEDCWHDNYQGAPTDGSVWKEANNGDCSLRVIRGGWWSSYPRDLRTAVRRSDSPGTPNNFAGFRIARDF
jgi:formylglycine-generating enzyme required for sulfatase activity